MKKILVGILSLLVISLIYNGFLLVRNSQVYSFRQEIVDICCDYDNSDMPDKKIKDAHLILNSLPSYNEMLYSLTPLNLNSYLNEKVIKELDRTYEYNLNQLN